LAERIKQRRAEMRERAEQTRKTAAGKKPPRH
jgi:hypothetical protein